MAVCASVFLSSSFAEAIVVQPAELKFAARVDDALLLKLEVDLEKAVLESFTVDFEGFQGDRRVLMGPEGKLTVEIAPDTGLAGSVNGKILLKSRCEPVGNPISISGLIRPWVTVQPARLFVGSIGHGAEFAKPQSYSVTLSSDNEPFDVDSVTFPGIEGAAWACAPEEAGSVQKKHLLFTFSPDALAANVPYGALTKKSILIHLTHAREPVIILPVQGLVSVNTTGRDYSQYLYNGHVRWQGPWATPNVAASFMATALVFFCGLASAFHRYFPRRSPGQVAWMVTTCVSLGIGCWLLAATYSRGGWFAALLGIGLLLFAFRGQRFYVLIFLGLFITAIALHPAGLSRAASTTLVSEDRSIHHRLLVWIGALQMMAEHPWSGVGAGQFGKSFETDYQQPTHTADYTTAINDFLTLGAERGFPALLFVATFFLNLTGTALKIGTRRGDLILSACGAATACYLVCCCFSSIGLRWNPALLPLLLTLGIIGKLLWITIRSPDGISFRRVSRASLGWLAISTLILGIFTTAEIGALFLRPVVSKIAVPEVAGIEVRPRWQSSKGTVLYIGDYNDGAAMLLKSTLRPLAQRGWTVFALQQPCSSPDILADLSSQVEKMCNSGVLQNHWQLAGHRHGAQLALALASRFHPQSVACYLTPFRSSFPNLSPCSTLPGISCPVLLAAQDADPLRTHQHLPALQRVGQGAGKNIRIDTHNGAFPIESARWQLWIQSIEKFCTF